MNITIQEAIDYPRTMGAAFAFRENVREVDDDVIIRAVEIAMEQDNDLLRKHVEQALEERRA